MGYEVTEALDSEIRCGEEGAMLANEIKLIGVNGV